MEKKKGSRKRNKPNLQLQVSGAGEYKMKKAVKVNHFDRLPDVLIIEILNKLVRAKYLLRFCSVCQRFASLADGVDTTILIPSPRSLSRSSGVGQFPLLALNKFTGIRSLQIEFWRSSHIAAAAGGGGSSARMKCKAVIGARLEVFVAVIARSVRKSQHLSDDGGDTPNYDIGIEEEVRLTLIREGLDTILCCHRFVQSLINGFDLPKLCELGVTCKRLGFSVDLGKEQIVELRNRRGDAAAAAAAELNLCDVIGGDGVVWVKSWHGPMLFELPSSGRVMERATIAVVKPEAEEIVMEKDIGALLGVFGGGGRGGGRRRRRRKSRRRNDDDGEAIDEFVNLVRKMMVQQSNQHGDSIQTHRLELV